MTARILNNPFTIIVATLSEFPCARLNVVSTEPVVIQVNLNDQYNITLATAVNEEFYKKSLKFYYLFIQISKIENDLATIPPLDTRSFSVEQPIVGWQKFRRANYEKSGKLCINVIIDYLKSHSIVPTDDLIYLGFAPNQILIRDLNKNGDLKYFITILNNDPSLQSEIERKFPIIMQQIRLFEAKEDLKQITLENNQVFENIIENGRKWAVEDSQDPDEKEKTLKDVIRTVMKGRELATGILVNRGESVYIAQKDKGLPLRLVEKRKFLGEGEYSTVHEVHNLAMGCLQAVKIAKETDPKGGAVKNENALLKWIHRNGHVKGIQDPPHFVIDLLDSEDCVGHVIDMYDINLGNIKFLTETSLKKKIYGCLSLFNGADFLHKDGIVHCDFKPENFCLYNSEFQIADFGHAREIGKISLQHPLGPLGVSTPIFTSKEDERENARINQTYWMHRMAIHKVRSPLKQASILKSAIDDPRFNIDREAAKRYIAFALINSKYSDMQINKIGFSREELEKEIQKSPAQNEKPLDLSQYELNETQLKKLKEDANTLCNRHDVYSFGLAILCILNGTRYIPSKKIKDALEKLLQNQIISPLNKKIVNLLRNMLAKDPSKRPTLHEAHLKYQEIAHQVS